MLLSMSSMLRLGEAGEPGLRVQPAGLSGRRAPVAWLLSNILLTSLISSSIAASSDAMVVRLPVEVLWETGWAAGGRVPTVVCGVCLLASWYASNAVAVAG